MFYAHERLNRKSSFITHLFEYVLETLISKYNLIDKLSKNYFCSENGNTRNTHAGYASITDKSGILIDGHERDFLPVEETLTNMLISEFIPL